MSGAPLFVVGPHRQLRVLARATCGATAHALRHDLGLGTNQGERGREAN